MRIYKQIQNKRRVSFFILGSFFVLFLVLSFFSINNVYGYDNEVILDNNVDTSLSNDLNRNNLFLDDNLDFSDEPIQNTLNEPLISRISSAIFISDISMFNFFSLTFDHVELRSNSIDSTVNYIDSSLTSVNKDTSISWDSQYSITQSLSNNSYLRYQKDYFTNDNHFKGNYKSTDVYYIIGNDNSLEKTEKQFTKLDNIDLNNIYSVFQYYDSDFNNDNYFTDINNYINYNIVFLTSSSDLKSLKNTNNFIKEVSNINLNKDDCKEDTSIVFAFQSSGSKPTFTILFFIKVFMEHHDNGKEHLNSF